MENPCNECLVKPACTEICGPKINYGTLLSGAIGRYGMYMGSLSPRFFQRNKAMAKNYESKSVIHYDDLRRIDQRSRGML